MFNDAHVWKKSDKDYYLYKDDNKWVFFDQLEDGRANFLTTEEGFENSVIARVVILLRGVNIPPGYIIKLICNF